MGYYVNPDGQSKEEWLEAQAVEFDGVEAALATVEANRGQLLLVVLIDNQIFTAAAVCYCQSEVEVFTDTTDGRPRRWFVAGITDLLNVVDGLEQELNR